MPILEGLMRLSHTINLVTDEQKKRNFDEFFGDKLHDIPVNFAKF